MSGDVAAALKRIVAGATLSADEAANAFAEIMRGDVAHTQIAGFLTALSMREPSVEEIVGAARAMRAAMVRVRAPDGAIDMCGTGGDGHNTFNISTAASLIVAACGVPVAKHGNRSASSRSGTADVLEALGVRIDAPPAAADRALRALNFAFFFAPAYHPAMKHVATVRKELGFRTIFNLLGPLANPAGVRRQLLGVFSAAWVERLAHVLIALDCDAAMIVHGHDGLDELTTTAPTAAAIVDRGRVSLREIDPDEIGVPRVELSALRGGDAAHNAAALLALLEGAHGPFRDVALLNAAAGLVVAGKARDLAAGASIAAQAIDSGAARNLLHRVAANLDVPA